jgi:hypothetical protein
MTPSSHPSIDELAAGEIDDTDIANLQRMQQMYERLDPPPSGLVDRISFGITLEALHAEIAEIQRVDGLVGVRSEGVSEAQTITFTSSTLTTMVTISPAGPDDVRIDGWIAPGGGVEVELRHNETSRHTVADADGRFVFDNVPHGLVGFVMRVPGGDARPVVTPSIEL